jgi:chromate transporter
MVAYIRTMAVERKRWIDARTFGDGVALCQAIPGATAMQAAAYVGLKTRGVIGAAASYVGFGLPAFLMMMTLAAVYTHTRDLPVVVSAFSGLQAVIVAIIAYATLSFGKTTLKDWRAIAIASMAAVLFALNLHPILVMLLAAAVGVALVKSGQSTPRDTSASPQTQPNTMPLLAILAVTALGFILLWLFDRSLFNLALLMFRIDLFAFGGGFASVPLMFHEVVEVRNWIDSQTLMNGIVLGQVTPGPIVITATFVGYLMAGFRGAVIATMAIFLPSFVILVGASPYFERLRASPLFNRAITGVLCSFVGLLATVTVRFASNVQWDLARLVLAAGAFVALLLKVDILWVVVLGTILSIAMFT